jgi:uncharacterized protein (TIGR00251 family)
MAPRVRLVVDDLFDITGTPADDEPATVVLRVHVQPGAGRTAVTGRHGTSLKVRVGAPPEGGRANEATRQLLAETFGVAASAIELSGGATSRMKRFTLAGVDLHDFRGQLERAVDEGNAGAGPGRSRTR